MLQKLLDWHVRTADTTEQYRHPINEKIAVDGQFALGNIAGRRSGLPTTRAACRSFVTRLRSNFGVHLYWSPSALHFHKLRILRKDQDALLRERARYMSQAVSNVVSAAKKH
jgi:hypothetical protein